MLLYIMERNNIIKNLLLLFAALLSGSNKRVDALNSYLDEVLHMVDPKEIKKQLERKRRIFETWTRMEPFTVTKLPTPDELIRQAKQQEEAIRLAAKFSNLVVKDSLIEELP